MDLKKMCAVFLAVLMVVSLIPLAFAEDNETTSTEDSGNETTDGTDEDEVTEEDEKEVASMNSPYGAQIRLLQLERAVTKSVLVGAKIIEYIEENYPDADLTELNSILDEMELLVEEIQGMDFEGDSRELAQDFVDIKHEARDLAKEFKKLSREILSETDIMDIRERLKDMDESALEDLDEDVKSARCEFNAERLKKVFERLGIEDDELVGKVAACEADMEQIRNELGAAFKNLTSQQKNGAVLKVREAMVKRAVYMKAVADKVRSNHLQRLSNRTQVRSNQLERLSDRAREEGFENRAERLRNASNMLRIASDRLERRSDWLGNRTAAIRDKIRARQAAATANSGSAAGSDDSDGGESE